MTRQGISGTDRKCRNDACEKWSFFRPEQDSRRCGWCGSDYGKVALGLDVTRFKTPAVKLTAEQKREADALKGSEAADVPKPRKGEFRGA